MRSNPQFIEGMLEFSTRKIELVTPNERYFVLTRGLSGIFLHGDRVLAKRVRKSGRGKQREVMIVRCLSHSTEKLLGVFHNEGDTPVFTLLKEQGRFSKRYSSLPEGYKYGDIVYCRFDIRGGITLGEVFAEENDFDREERLLFALAGTSPFFPQVVSEEAKHLKPAIIEGRKDFRSWYTLTIDGSDAKDLDDALSIKLLDNGHMLLAVHIADVSEYVSEESKLDREAYKRATSIYTPGKVVPMLPEELSNNLCSLHPGSPKATLTCLMEIDTKGCVLHTDIMESVIESQKKGVYEEIENAYRSQDFLSKDESDTIQLLYRLYDILKERRKKEGKILFESTEMTFVFGKEQVSSGVKIPKNIQKRTRVDAHMLIEECMILANEEVAKWCTKNGIPFYSRIHSLPGNDQSRYIEYILSGSQKILFTHGKEKELHPRDIRNFMDLLSKKETYRYSRLLLPKMAKAHYSEKKDRHFGLALEYYAHFTSPIRRYPDLQVHRIIKEYLHKTLTKEQCIHYKKILEKGGRHMSEKERHAEELERKFDALYACRYMQKFVGTQFFGRVSGISQNMLYIELDNGVECMRELPYGIYQIDEFHGIIRGKKGNIIAMIGQELKVTIEAVNMEERKIFAREVLPSFGQF